MFPADAPSAAHALAAQLLTGRRTTQGARIPQVRYRQAIAGIGAGPEHLTGEVAVALVDEQLDRDRFGDGAIVTDCRLVARAGTAVVNLAYPALESASSYPRAPRR